MSAFPEMLRRDRERWGMRECQAAWRFGLSVREYRELEAGERWPDSVTWDRICELYGCPKTFVGGRLRVVSCQAARSSIPRCSRRIPAGE
ncbi:MAG: helix-turn-helix transcriptional regulator [Actinobacteria bacterium]|nr:MAG: helix-turn-helix transcriptional regulator [Actinomycetota bacterium]